VAVESSRGRQRLEIVRGILEAFDRRDWDAAGAHAHPRMENRLREGMVHGFEHTVNFMRAQAEQFAEFRLELNEAYEVGDDTLITCVTAIRRPHGGGDPTVMWPAQVFRFDDDDRIVYLEGFARHEDALVAHGITERPRRTHDRRGTAIDVEALQRTFAGGIEAVAGIDLAVDEAEIYAFLGPNGAGKTTTVRMLTTLLRPTGGKAVVAGYDVVRQPHQVRRSIGVALQEAALDPLMTGAELMILQATLHGIRAAEARQRARMLLERVGLEDAAGRRVGTYSGGMRRRLDLAMALIHDPRVLFLDEPTTGLDPQSRRAIWDEVRRLNEDGTTVFLTTQYLEEADQLADRVGIIDKGRMAAEGTPASLKARMGRSYLELGLAGTDGASADAILERFGEVMPASNGTVRVALPHGSADVAPIVRALDDARIQVESLRLVEPTLDDVFLATTGQHLDVDPDEGAAEGG
jgi:ABC-2 type transport system ATP-binding protein